MPVLDNSNCKSENCIYIIFCGLCNAFYIGQTINLKDRVYNHIYCIKNFKPYLLEDFKCVSLHFNLKFHNYKKHLSFFVIKNNINSLNLRLYIESFLKLNLILDNSNRILLKTNRKEQNLYLIRTPTKKNY